MGSSRKKSAADKIAEFEKMFCKPEGGKKAKAVPPSEVQQPLPTPKAVFFHVCPAVGCSIATTSGQFCALHSYSLPPRLTRETSRELAAIRDDESLTVAQRADCATKLFNALIDDLNAFIAHTRWERESPWRNTMQSEH